MATYAIGDLQGCRKEFQALLQKLGFSRDDRLWLLGDLINRGADSLGTLQDVMAIDNQCEVVLGNHDLHFLAIYLGGHNPSRNDTFDEMLDHADAGEMAAWLCQQSLMHTDDNLGYCMSHAGIPHIWSEQKAASLAAEMTAVLRDEHATISRRQFFEELYGNEPARWHDDLDGMPRLRLIANYFTRMRLIDRSGTLEFGHKGVLADAPAGWSPWYELKAESMLEGKLLFGHWAALDGHTGKPNICALDTGCVWGRHLTALCLETGVTTSVAATPHD